MLLSDEFAVLARKIFGGYEAKRSQRQVLVSMQSIKGGNTGSVLGDTVGTAGVHSFIPCQPPIKLGTPVVPVFPFYVGVWETGYHHY